MNDNQVRGRKVMTGYRKSVSGMNCPPGADRCRFGVVFDVHEDATRGSGSTFKASTRTPRTV